MKIFSNKTPDGRWFSKIENSFEARASASFWRWCGSVASQMLGGDWWCWKEQAVYAYRSAKELVAALFWMTVSASMLALFPVFVPLCAWIGRRNARLDYDQWKSWPGDGGATK